MIKKKVRAFTSRFVNFIYFSSSKTHFSTLAIIFYNIPHIPLFILQYIQLKYYKIILFFFFHSPNHTHTGNHQTTATQINHTHSGNSKQLPNPPQNNHQTHGNTKSTTPTPVSHPKPNHNTHAGIPHTESPYPCRLPPKPHRKPNLAWKDELVPLLRRNHQRRRCSVEKKSSERERERERERA